MQNSSFPSFFTDEQCLAASHSEGHARIVAVAGAGKTATLTHYLAHKLQHSQAPRRTLVLMYNRAAQQTFLQRLSALTSASLPEIRTFHSLGLKIYQRLIQSGSLPPVRPDPLPDRIAELQLRTLLQQKAPQQFRESPDEWLELAKDLLQRLKSDLREIEDVLPDLNPPPDSLFLVEIIRAFEQWRKREGWISYDDMLYDPVCLFVAQPELQAPFRNQLDEILVDEYQDINPIQHFLLRLLAGDRAKVMVIGDPDQTIYEFRGSSPDFITRTFAEDFAQPTTYCLSRTFRFGHALALSANHLIRHNRGREPILTLSAESAPNTKIQTSITQDHGAKIVDTIQWLQKRNAPLTCMAVLCRLWSYARPVELQLMSRGIPYRMEGEQSILQCQEIRPFWHCLELLSGDFFNKTMEQKTEALFELLTTPSLKIPHHLLRKISQRWASEMESPIFLRNRLGSSLLNAITADCSPFQTRSLRQLADALDALNRSEKNCAQQIVNFAKTAEYQTRLRKNALNPTEGQEQAATAEAFLRFILQLKISSPEDLLHYLHNMQSRHNEANMDGVTLTTIHRSKGLEWPVVFIPNLAEGHLPYLTGRESEPLKALESERRLMYVAITRAQKQLFMTLPDPLDAGVNPSRFIEEMQLDLSNAIAKGLEMGVESIDLPEPATDVAKQYLAAQLSSLQLNDPINTPSTAPCVTNTSNHQYTWKTGQKIRHAILGVGEIEALDAKRIHIRFTDGSLRVFASDFAFPHLTLL